MLDWRNYIERNPQVMLGKPVLKGTRITVEFIVERLGQGATPDELVREYIGLTPDHIRAALASTSSTPPSESQTATSPPAPSGPRP